MVIQLCLSALMVRFRRTGFPGGGGIFPGGAGIFPGGCGVFPLPI